MDVVITPKPLSGQVTAPPSKSAAHRVAICCALSSEDHILSPAPATDDMKATADCITALGGTVEDRGESLKIGGITGKSLPVSADIDCNESGSTIRFFIPIAAALGISTLFRGRGNLPNRPLTVLVDLLQSHGVACTEYGGTDGNILKISGKLTSGEFVLPGNISSQYITGLLFALPLLEGPSEICLSTPLESRGYVDLTLQALSDSGVAVTGTKDGWLIPGGQTYSPGLLPVEGDYSGGAFWLCAGAMGQSPVTVSGLRPDSLQGDRAVLDILHQFGVKTDIGKDITVFPGALKATDIDVSQIPDLAPVLAVVAACAKGTSTIYNAERLRIKESDRLRSMTEGLNQLGAHVEEHQDKLVIHGKQNLSGGTCDSFADHRIAMAMSIAAIRCENPVTVTGAHCVAKSYPNFYEHYKQLGGDVSVL